VVGVSGDASGDGLEAPGSVIKAARPYVCFWHLADILFAEAGRQLLTQTGHWVGNEQEAIAYYRKAFEIDAFGGSERQPQAFGRATLKRQPFDRQTKPKN
jgi:hypothetical protein